jgi:transposase
MDESINFFVGLDAHKDSISVAVCEAGREPSRFVGTLGPDVQGVIKTLRKYGPARHVSVVYEAGPTGYGLYRELSRRGYRCEIIAPSLTPRVTIVVASLMWKTQPAERTEAWPDTGRCMAADR